MTYVLSDIRITFGANIWHGQLEMWWANKSQVTEAPPAPTNRREELMNEFRAVEAELCSLNLEISAFRRRNGIITDFFQRIVRCESPTLTGRQAIETQWRSFFKRVDALFPKRNKLLSEISALKKE